MSYYQPRSFNFLPEVVKNLMIINGLFFLATIVLDNIGLDLIKLFGLHMPGSPNFMPHQIITHIFMHGSLGHIFSNLFMLWMFGYMLENVWGNKRFLIYYMATGLGAAALQIIVNFIKIKMLESQIDLSNAELESLIAQGNSYLQQQMNFVDPITSKLNLLYNVPMVGASGAVFGVLLAFGMLFPNTLVYFIFFPFPIKAKWLVIGYGFFELWSGFNTSDNIAHFAHLGGMLFGYILIKYWNKNRTYFY